jgi:hypothetical protein
VVNFYSAGVVTHDRGIDVEANPTTASYKASVVSFYNATGGLARFKKQKIFYFTLKNALAY